jgi:hypothetical protein
MAVLQPYPDSGRVRLDGVSRNVRLPTKIGIFQIGQLLLSRMTNPAREG